MIEAYFYYEPSTNSHVLRQGESRQEFTPEQWVVICMAANNSLANSVCDLQHLLKFKNQRIEELSNELTRIKSK
ncbi:hypothetical protein C7387_4341 [Yokenella regensburgei]|uniref:Uncharacterized protein n=2 Tax=Yokenella regensburgei TaxID=158877 RepID=A0ABX9RT70_9ENTR|nr:hypothetical protein C7387_4341 [Yokenella regensburgei]VFS16089.1 Uncharacterised protein [Yokenella regensburgei]